MKRTLLLSCISFALIVVILGGVFLFDGCDSADIPNETTNNAGTGDQTTEDALTEKDTAPSSDLPEIDTNDDGTESGEEPHESQTPSFENTTTEPQMPSDSVTVAPELPTEPEPLTYEEYGALSSQEQEAYFLSFSSIEAFFEWYNAAKQKYQEENPGVEIGPGGFLPIP